MKLKSALIGAAVLVTFAAGAQAGPAISVSIGTGGGGCVQRPVVCPPRPGCRTAFVPTYCAPVVFYNQAPVFNGNVTRFSTVSGFVNGGQGVIQVARPIYPVQPVVIHQGPAFRWR
ncbi:MAG: hypothetical protein IAE94_10505 [Chthoniobacterales bacterium]|nr:hypothetical protein [Chthoniobacterales bacterium]